MADSNLVVNYYDSPCGRLILGADDKALCICDWVNGRYSRGREAAVGSNDIIRRTIARLDSYFDGELIVFDLPLKLYGTEFEKKVWRSLTLIQYGQTISYGDFARLIGRTTAVRAIARAIGKNPLSIILPCHRVIGRNGQLTGYNGGIETKRYLLDLEFKNLFKTEFFSGFDGKCIGT